MRRLKLAIGKRQSQLIWGPSGAGKTFLIQELLASLPEADRHKCIYVPASKGGRDLAAHFLRSLYLVGDPFVRRKVHCDGAGEVTLNRWIGEQSFSRMRGILFSATELGDYRIFVDHLPLPTSQMVHFIEEIMYRCKTPVYMTGHGYSQGEIGRAWSLYWCDRYRTHLGPLTETPARELLEMCIHKFALDSMDLGAFRNEILRLSGCLPGSIVKMCEIAADPRYHYHNQIKIKLVHVDYLMRTNPDEIKRMPIGPQ